MKIKNSHIIFSLLVFGIISFTSVEIDSFSNSSFFIETEIEESINDISELDFEKEFSLSNSDGGGNAAVLNTNQYLTFLCYNTSLSQSTYKKELSSKPQLFILYCRLKLDC